MILRYYDVNVLQCNVTNSNSADLTFWSQAAERQVKPAVGMRPQAECRRQVLDQKVYWDGLVRPSVRPSVAETAVNTFKH